jgi:hypothetical protein
MRLETTTKDYKRLRGLPFAIQLLTRITAAARNEIET